MVQISVLSVAYFLSAVQLLHAQNTDTTQIKIEYNLEEIDVEGQLSPEVFSQLARVVTVITQKEIEALPQQSIQDVLEYYSGIDVRQRGAEGVQADVGIRGGNFDQTLILLNGINITDPQTSHHNFNLPVDLSQLERIEILEGPAARVYGPNAFSGAINLVTKKARYNELAGSLTAGSYGYFSTNISGAFKVKNFNQLLSLNHKTSDGYIENTDFKQSNLYYSNTLSTSKGKLEIQTGFLQKGFGANSFYTPKYPNQYEEINLLFASAGWASKGKLHLSPALYFRKHHDRFELFRDNPAPWYNGHNYHVSNVHGGTVNSWIQRKMGKTAFCVEIRFEEILSNILGEPLSELKKIPGEDAFFSKTASRFLFSGFAEHSILLNGWYLNAGALINRYSYQGLNGKVFPGIDASKEISETSKLFASFNTSLRLPTFTDLYYSGPTNIGNSELKPEKSATVEGGFKYAGKILQVNWSVFYRSGKDIIDWIKTNSGEKWQPQNLTRLNHLGTQIGVKIIPDRNAQKWKPNLISINYLFQHGEKTQHQFISNYVLDYLKHKLVCSINQPITPNINFDLKLLLQDRAGTFTKYVINQNGTETDYPLFFVADAKVLYQKNGFQMYLSVNNIFNQDYFDIGNVLQPGRWIKTGIAYQLRFN